MVKAWLWDLDPRLTLPEPRLPHPRDASAVAPPLRCMCDALGESTWGGARFIRELGLCVARARCPGRGRVWGQSAADRCRVAAPGGQAELR